MMAMDVQREGVSSKNGCQIDCQKLPAPNAQFDPLAEKQEGHHVQYEVPRVSVQKPGRDETIILFSGEDRFGVENVFLLETVAAEAAQRNDAGNADNGPSAPGQF